MRAHAEPDRTALTPPGGPHLRHHDQRAAGAEGLVARPAGHVGGDGSHGRLRGAYYLLEDTLNVILVNAAHAKGLPGRKTDVSDSAWLAQLGECGLVKASFVPPEPVRHLRDFTAVQIDEIATREAISWVFCDDDLAERVPAGLLLVSLDGVYPNERGTLSLAELASCRPGRPPELRRPSRHVILTSGTTGTPRGVARDNAPIEAAVALLDVFPFRQRETHVIAAPLFHAWGWLNHRICPLYDATEVLVRRPDGERVLRLAAQYRAEVVIATPVVLRRMLEVPTAVREELDLSALRVVAVSGALIPPEQVVAFAAAFGDVLHNLYGSTEAAFATCARPGDLRADPATAGRPLSGVRVEVLDDAGGRCAAGVEGMVWVGSRTSFGGYTDGTDRARHRGLVGTGDIGAWDEAGRLRVLGRADDVIISGGENVHPEEAERVLRRHPEVADVAVVGAPDPVFGQVVVAHVVRRVPASAEHRQDGVVAAQPDWESAFLAWAAERLAPHQRPRQVLLHAELPRNATGKVQRRLLADA